MPKQEGWREDAACRGADLDLFFPVSDDDAGPAKSICATCPVRDDCLEWSLATRQEDGIFGGLTPTERRRLRRRRRTAARITAAAGGQTSAA
ncbi:MAG TPA: WhiB family transcriptional regulator [Acidimicrobiales bacterium]|nr:WhiB family transcriptional regulator [Acidimicrobiales bacterium]